MAESVAQALVARRAAGLQDTAGGGAQLRRATEEVRGDGEGALVQWWSIPADGHPGAVERSEDEKVLLESARSSSGSLCASAIISDPTALLPRWVATQGVPLARTRELDHWTTGRENDLMHSTARGRYGRLCRTIRSEAVNHRGTAAKPGIMLRLTRLKAACRTSIGRAQSNYGPVKLAF